MIQLKHSDWKTSEQSGDIQRFLKAQMNMYETALAEIKQGHKQSHWIWYVFPQLKGLGRTYNSNFYGITDLAEAKEYLKEPTLRARLLELCDILLQKPHNDATIIFGELDAKKLRSSMTLFDLAEPNSIFANVLTKYFNGKRCVRSLRILNKISPEHNS